MLKQAQPETQVAGGEDPERRLPPYDVEFNDSDPQNAGEAKKSASNDPFGSEDVAEVKYRTMTWWQCGMLMIAENVSLGILSIPSTMAVLGMVPAAILIVFLSAISWYTGYIIGQFKVRYPHVHSMGDAGEIIFGPAGRVLLELAQLLLLIFVMASHILTGTILLSTITKSAVCGIVFGVVSLIICFLGALPRTMARVYWLSTISFASIIITTIVTMVSIGVQSEDPVEYHAFRQISFYEGFLAFTNIMFGFIVHVTFFGLISETQSPEQFPKSLAMLQITDTVLYLVAGLVIYRYSGQDVKSPAPSSAGPLMKRICFGLAIPTVYIAGIVVGHVACKYVYVRILRGSSHMHRNSFVGIGTWVGIAGLLWTIAWIIAESIPGFNDLLSFISALFGSILSYAIPAIFWLYMNKGRYTSTISKTCLTVLNLVIFGIGCFMCGAGLYVSGRALKENSAHSSWSCAVST
ncbi:unnamed protein product [Penicillium olsonii]|uniref:Amino acid transporter transmembrane domain-containing protein n=1 Tax=Penicillium olsonii TaxID=99116 RepID=A0A9W4HBL1_PENOL|nr:unnamed protein product [Penicillium olsonii]CAG7934047.1 unnamed protein product [Penicillium olsonii]CAG7958827.1 unnamed protein product [Penicillium olsonii]CAG7975803.1 unnamed protein product [Penicillium olsonii]CAG8221699.1 unnamed protein product [Penicillium olsonii]